MKASRTSRAARLGATLALSALLASGLAGCGGSGDSNPNPPPATGTISGIVVALRTGQALSGVVVSAAGRTTTTDTSGRYTLTDVPAGDPAVVKFDSAGYVRTLSSVRLVDGASVFAHPQLTAVAITQQFNAADATVVRVPNSSGQVSLPASSLVDAATGAPAGGLLSAEVTPIDPAANPAAMPGNFQATGATAPVAIESFGALSVVLRDSAGNLLDLASGKTASLRIPVATRAADLPASIPLYYFDETRGLWVEQGSATLRGVASAQFYEGTVQHFTTWGAHRPIDTVRVSGCVREANGAPAQGVTVEANGTSYSGAASMQTDAQGSFTLPLRRGGMAALYGQLADRFTSVLSVGPADVDQTLPNCLQVEAGNLAPAIVQHPLSQAVPTGGCAVFSVQAIGPPPLTYQWYTELVISAGTTPTLTICPVGFIHNLRDFTAVVTNGFGTAVSRTAVLTVLPPTPPQILTQPAGQQVQGGATATFSVEAVAIGSPIRYQWLRGGAPIAGATGSSYTTPPTSLADNGAQFSVVVTTDFGGSVTSDSAQLIVSA